MQMDSPRLLHNHKIVYNEYENNNLHGGIIMLDKLYDDIGGKIKGWARWMFVIESIAAIVTGISLLLDSSLVFLGFILIIFGPVVAFVSTWLLYAIGEIVDYLELIEENTSSFYKKTKPEKSVNKVATKNKKSESTQTAGDEDPFQMEIMNMSKEDLRLILEDQQDMYNPDEIAFIQSVYDWKKHK